MNCPYEVEFGHWGSVYPMGAACHTCEDFDCEHNTNRDNPELVELDEELAVLFTGGGKYG